MDIVHGSQTDRRTFKSQDWGKYREEIIDLYENNKLEIVMNIIEERHGLVATYVRRVLLWSSSY